jgi:hypothetical protein
VRYWLTNAIALVLVGVTAGFATEIIADGPFEASGWVFRGGVVVAVIVIWELVRRVLARRDHT